MRPTGFRFSSRDPHRRTRALAALAASLLVVTGTVRLWPLRPALPEPSAPRASVRPVEVLPVELLPPTRQPPAEPPPPPAAPPPDGPPEEVPDDRVLAQRLAEEAVVPLPPPETPASAPLTASPAIPAPAAPAAPPPPPGPARPAPPPPPRTVERPEQGPRAIRQPVPAYPPQADGLRARALVDVLVGETGAVLEAVVAERVVLDRRGRETRVDVLPHGMDALALETARRFQFRPAQDGGERVRARTRITVAFDPP
ncbi:MAG: hypothetical protein ACK41D_06550 [Rubricoccaceae bacterium]